jgi:acyl-CoA thioester hydrolase
MKIRVYYEDTDVGGVVYHSNYLNFCERARSELFFKKGISPILSSGHFVARRIEADYFIPAKFADELFIETKIDTVKNASFTLIQTVFKEEKILFKLKIILAYITFEGKVQKFGDDVKKVLLEVLPQ